MEPAYASEAIVVTAPIVIDCGGWFEPGAWISGQVPMAILCFGAAAMTTCWLRHHFEVVGAAIALASGLAIVSMCDADKEILVEHLSHHRAWLLLVTLLGAAGGHAARVAGPLVSGDANRRAGAQELLRHAAIVLLGSAITLVPGALLVFGLLELDSVMLSLSLLVAYVASLAVAGWMVGRLVRHHVIASAVVAAMLPAISSVIIVGGDLAIEADLWFGSSALFAMPAAVAAHAASSVSARAAAQREADADSYGSDVVRFAGLGVMGSAMIMNVVAML
jgi:hypothetical protein